MKLIVIAKANTASVNIGKVLKKKYPNIDAKIFEIKDNVLDLDKYEKEFQTLAEQSSAGPRGTRSARELKPELIIVASSHRSEAGIPMLNCHAPGNWSSADLGGKTKTLSIAPALYIREGILEFKKLKEMRKELSSYEIGMEVTHHSPTIPFPVMFVEVGSSEKQWSDMKACEAAADVINKLCVDITPEEHEKKVSVAIGFGGGHYCPRFNGKLQEIAFGHICPKHQADNLDEEMILQAYNKTIPTPDFAAIEWKGLSSLQKKKITELLDKNKIPWKKV